MRHHVLIVENQPTLRRVLETCLESCGIHSIAVASLADARAALVNDHLMKVVVCDLNIGNDIALDVVRLATKVNHRCRCIVICGAADLSIALQAGRVGASDILPKPIATQTFVDVVKKHLGPDKQAIAPETDPFAGTSEYSARLRSTAELFASADLPILIEGETGTGKGVLSRWIHRRSRRHDARLIEVNCASIPHDLLESELFGHEKGAFTGANDRKTGLWEAANGGTIFLDEIGEMPSAVQCKLLKTTEDNTIRRLGALDEIPIDARIIAATNLPIQELVARGGFRADLFHRISTLRVQLKPLRERLEDIPCLATDMLRQLSASTVRLTDAATEKLLRYHWPGNIRELRNVLQRSLLKVGDAAEIRAGDIHFDAPVCFPKAEPQVLNAREAKRQLYLAALDKANGQKKRAAELLGISCAALYYQLNRLGIETHRPSKVNRSASVSAFVILLLSVASCIAQEGAILG